MKRQIKFRALTSGSSIMVFGDLIKLDDDLLIAGSDMSAEQFNNGEITLSAVSVWPESVGQYTGLKDKKGIEIYEGDILRYRNPEIGYQTHTGDNIPNGSYTEPTGAIISEKEYEVVFSCGSFQLLDTNTSHTMPMQYLFDEQTDELIELDHDTILRQLDLKRNRDIFDNDYSDAQEELECLLAELEMTLSTLIDHCKLEIISSIHEKLIIKV